MEDQGRIDLEQLSIIGMAIKSHLLDGLGFKKEKMFSVFFERIHY